VRRVMRTTVTLERGTRARADQALRRPKTRLAQLVAAGELTLQMAAGQEHVDMASVETEFKYAGYLRRQEAAVERSRHEEHRKIPEDFQYEGVPGLSNEIVQRLSETRPETLGQALRVPGVTPAAVAIISVYINRRTRKTKARRRPLRWER